MTHIPGNIKISRAYEQLPAEIKVNAITDSYINHGNNKESDSALILGK